MSGAWVPQQFATGANSGATSGPIAPTTYPQKVAAGSLLVCVAYWLTSADTVTVADNVDGAWTAAGAKVYDTATATAMQVFFLAKATTADTTPRTVTATISANDTYTQLNVYEFHHTNGALTGTPTTDGYAAKANGTSSAAPTATAITTATAGDLIFSTIIGPNSSTVSPGAGYAPGGANAGGLTGDEYLTQVTAGSITPAFVASPAMAYSVIDVAIKATVPTVTPVSSSNASTTTTGTAVTCTLPTWTIGNGDPIFLLVAATVSTTISTPTGYWPVMQTQPGTPTVALFMKYARSGDSGASVSATLGAPAGWSVIAYVPTPGSATAYTVDANSVSANHAASLTGAFAAAARSTSNVPTVGTVNGAIGIGEREILRHLHQPRPGGIGSDAWRRAVRNVRRQRHCALIWRRRRATHHSSEGADDRQSPRVGSDVGDRGRRSSVDDSRGRRVWRVHGCFRINDRRQGGRPERRHPLSHSSERRRRLDDHRHQRLGHGVDVGVQQPEPDDTVRRHPNLEVEHGRRSPADRERHHAQQRQRRRDQLHHPRRLAGLQHRRRGLPVVELHPGRYAEQRPISGSGVGLLQQPARRHGAELELDDEHHRDEPVRDHVPG
jgi:hypothetical protein